MPAPIDAALHARMAAARVPSLAAAQAWRDGAAWRHLAKAFADADDPEGVERAALRVLGNIAWLEPLLRPLLAALADDLLHEAPLRVSRDARKCGAILYERPGVTLAATVQRRRPLQPLAADHVVAPGRQSWMRAIAADGAAVHRWHAGAVAAAFTLADAPRLRALPPEPIGGDAVVALDGRHHAYRIEPGAADLVALTVVTSHGAAPLMREYDAGDGRLVRVAAVDDRASRQQMLLTFLRHMGRRDAAPAFEAATHDATFFARWDAMREWLALDGGAALPRLSEMAVADPHAEVRAAARAALALVDLKRPACPA